MFSVIGDAIEFEGWRVATFSPDIPASIRERAQRLLEEVLPEGELEAIRQETWDRAYDDGQQDGYEEGYDAGIRDGALQ